jgi:predicted CXXCH cytochrome family protein
VIDHEQSARVSPPPGRPEQWRLAVAIVALAGAGALGWWSIGHWGLRQIAPVDVGDAKSTPAKKIAWRTKPDYVGSAACQACHADQFASHQNTPHGRSLCLVSGDIELPDAVFDHDASGMRFRSRRVASQLEHEACLLLADGSEFGSKRFWPTHRLGTGAVARTYLIATDGEFVESPIAWWEADHRWGMSPGYDVPRHPSFRRVVNESCLGCHSGLVKTRVDDDLRMELVELAIGCERCHGPGRRHIEQESAKGVPTRETERAIVNPRRLSRSLNEAICQQCHLHGHLQVAARSVRSSDFLPGEPLENYRHDYRIAEAVAAAPTDAGPSQVGAHVTQLQQSVCYQKSEMLTCITCHNPHTIVAPTERSAKYRTICLTCHQEESCRAPRPERIDRMQNDCVVCHMPAASARTPHVAFTDHRIGVHPRKIESPPLKGGDRVVPLFDQAALSAHDRQRSLGLAWQQLFVREGGAREASPERRQAGDRAIELLSKLPEEFVDDVVTGALAELYHFRQETAAAERAAWRVLEFAEPSSSARVSARTVLGINAYDAGRFAEAVEHFRELNRLHRSGRDLMRQALCEYRLDETEAAIRTLQSSIDWDPATITDREFLAAIYFGLQDKAAEKGLKAEIRLLKRRDVALFPRE